MIRLHRAIHVAAFDVEGTVSFGRERPEFLAVARLAADLEHPLDGEDVSRELLGSLPAHVGWRVIERCLALGLLERKGFQGPAALSDGGRRALEEGQVLVPEEGVWRFYYARDPLLDDGLLHVVRLETPRADQERRALPSPAERRREPVHQGDGRPGPLAELCKRKAVWRSRATGQLFEVKELGERGVAQTPHPLDLTLEYAPEKPVRAFLRGQLKGGRPGERDATVDFPLGTPRSLGNRSYDDLWRELVGAATGLPPPELAEACRRAGALVVPTPFDDTLDRDARRTMLRDLRIPKVFLDGLGSFDETELPDVMLLPRTPADAQAWADWLLWESLETYYVPDNLETLRARVRGLFPLHTPRLATTEELLARAECNPADPRARFLLAPADLGLWRPS
jgi:hypothetical protein